MNLSLADLHTKFKKHTVIATLQCSGNRRAELSSIKQVKGLFWDNGEPSSLRLIDGLVTEVGDSLFGLEPSCSVT